MMENFNKGKIFKVEHFFTLKKKLGYTLVELIAVMGIFALTSTSIFGGILYLTASVKSDNLVYRLKGEIQAIQNLARSSSLNSTAGQIELGWIIEFSNNSTNNNISISRRPVYINYTTIGTLTEIVGLQDTIREKMLEITSMKLESTYRYVFCDGQDTLKYKDSSSDSSIQDLMISNLGAITCGSPIPSQNDIFTSALPDTSGMELVTDATTVTQNCYSGDKVSIFYSLGSGTVSFSGVERNNPDSSPIRWCQIAIRPRGSLTTGIIRGIQVSKFSGTVRTCSGPC